MRKQKDDATEAFKAIQIEADHILETLRSMQQEKTLGAMKAPMRILRDDAIAVKEVAMKACSKKDAKEKVVTEHLSDED